VSSGFRPDEDPTLSVVIAVRNGSSTLSDQLRSLSSQDFDRSWEVVVVDNGSTDDSIAVAKSFGSRLPGLRVVDASTRAGASYARNVGVGASRGSLLLFLDADDMIAPGYLAAMATAMDETPLVGARLDCDQLNPAWLRHEGSGHQTKELEVAFAFLPFAAGCSIGIRRSTFEHIGGFDPTLLLGEDTDLCWRAQLDSFPLGFVPDAVVHYRHRNTLRGIFTQASAYGAGGPGLYRRYRERGMPRCSWRLLPRFYGSAVLHLVRARSRSELAVSVAVIGYRIGLIKGSIRQRVPYL
jgi:GT2 family glycosyltransferase